MNLRPDFLDDLPAGWTDTPCRDYPLLFMHPTRTVPLKQDIEDAKLLCKGCPVIRQCRDYAIANDERDGIWGGLTPDERLTHRSAQEPPT